MTEHTWASEAEISERFRAETLAESVWVWGNPFTWMTDEEFELFLEATENAEER